ncbi:MAG: hypothetical protein U0794_05630 [Isosphaeraceae bacterium]
MLGEVTNDLGDQISETLIAVEERQQISQESLRDVVTDLFQRRTLFLQGVFEQSAPCGEPSAEGSSPSTRRAYWSHPSPVAIHPTSDAA